MSDKLKILYFSEMRPGANGGWVGGYSAITEGMALALTKLGHEVKVLGISYPVIGAEHRLPFSIIPLFNPEWTEIQLRDIVVGWQPDALVVTLDLPMHISIFGAVRDKVTYLGVYPVEGEPVLGSWAEIAALFDSNLTLSNFGVRALAKAGISSKLLPIGVTMNTAIAATDQIAKARVSTGLGEKFVILKIADNHQRKNMAQTIEFFARWGPSDSVLYLVTRPDLPDGWRLDELAEEYGGERHPNSTKWVWPNGKEMWMLTELTRNELSWAANLARYRGCLLMDTGNEGLSMPTLEAFYIGLPVVGMNHTAIGELLADGRGILFEPGYMYRDPWGNVKRYMIDYDSWAAALDSLYHNPALGTEVAKAAREWVEPRKWVKAAQMIVDEVKNAKN